MPFFNRSCKPNVTKPMKKTLILVRHAKSDWSINGQKDFDRTLNERGHSDAPRMGNKFASMRIMPDAIISSPAERAKLTAEYFAEQLKLDTQKTIFNANIYDASVRVLMNEINALENSYNTVMVFGHNPGLSYFAEYATKAEIGEMPTCAIIGISFEIDSWQMVSQGMGKVDFFTYPEN